MVDTAPSFLVPREYTAAADMRQLDRASVVNSGQDTKLTFCDGSTIVLKGVRQIGAVFSALSEPSPVGADIGQNR
jgi:hypothetical protein